MFLFGERLRDIREAHDMTQAELSIKIGVSLEEIACYENEWMPIPYGVLLKISQVLQVSTDTLLGNEQHYGETLNLAGLTKEEKTILKQLVDAFRRRPFS